MTAWEYHIESFNLQEKWGAGRQAQEIQKFLLRLNQVGAEGWEMVTQEQVQMVGSFTGNIKGFLTVVFFKRPL